MGHLGRASLRRSIGQRLHELRLRAGITSQEKLASLAGVHRTYVGRLERGETGVTVDTLAAVLAAMKVSLSEYFRPFNQPVSPPTPRRRD
jgi:transcriptional regulator with XRE-family HTH domain